MTYVPENRHVRAYFYYPRNKNTRMRPVTVHGWHIDGISRGGIPKPYGNPVLVQEDGSLNPHDPDNPDFLGISFKDSDREAFKSAAIRRWERENAARMKELAEQKKAWEAEHSAKQAEEKAAREAAEAHDEKKAATLANAETLIYGDD
ncbi:hypothetical protein [Streptomyces formicae]